MPLEDFVGMTVGQFLGTPEVVPTLPVELPAFFAPADPEPFMDLFTARIARDTATVHHNGQFVAGFRRGSDKICSTLYVISYWRRRGIGEELVYQCVVRHGTTTHARRRNTAGHAVYLRVWARIQTELQRLRTV